MKKKISFEILNDTCLFLHIEKEKKIEIPTTLKISDNNIILLNIFYCVVFHQLSFLIYKCIFHVVFSQKKNNIIIQCMYNVVLCMFYMSLHKFFFKFNQRQIQHDASDYDVLNYSKQSII